MQDASTRRVNRFIVRAAAVRACARKVALYTVSEPMGSPGPHRGEVQVRELEPQASRLSPG